MNNEYDVIIIGTGAGGGTLAYRLAPSGKRILLLERGDYLPREPDNWDSRAVFVRNKYKTHETWYDKDGQPFHPGQNYYVGGQTKFYGAILMRLRERDFGEVRHHGGISPAWPLSYGDFAPYYDEAERLYLVHGQRGEDPTEPPASGPYPYPAVSHEPRIQMLHDDLIRAGHAPFHLPLGVNLDESNSEKSPCVRCNYLDGFPCLVDGKADAHVLCIRPALRHPNVTLETNSKVVRLETDTSGRTVTGVVVERPGGQHETYRSDIVVVSCGAINSALLLLGSASDRHPNGLANSSDVVGRHYMAHTNSAVIAISKEPNTTKFQKTLGVNDYYWGADDFHFPLGHIQMLGKTDGQILKAGAPRPRPRLRARLPRSSCSRLLAYDRGSAHAREPCHARSPWPDQYLLLKHKPRAARTAAREAEAIAHPPQHASAPDSPPGGSGPAHPNRWRLTPVRHRSLRDRPSRVRPRPQLQGPRTGQPLRRRH